MAIKFAEARDHALRKGGSLEEIERQTIHYARQVGSVPFNHMIRALGMHSWNNTADQWMRLAAALKARSNARKGGR